MPKKLPVALYLILMVAFLLLNRAAYQGYFQADELDNLNWTSRAPVAEFVWGILTPRFYAQNFRPVGHAFFLIGEKLFGLRFPPYVALLQAIHLLNVGLLWTAMRRLGAPVAAAAAGSLFFALHMALFDAFWKPMYVFDVLCATFFLLSLLAWMRGRWIWSFVCFWLAYKAKELAVMLPLVLACLEWIFGRRKWKPLLPFFAASLSFGLQGLLLNPNRNNDYSFRFTPAALARTSVLYAGQMFLIPYLGFAAVPALLIRNKRLRFGLAAMAILFIPLLFLPGRVFPAYCYLPFVGLAIAISAFDPRVSLPLVLLLAPLQLRELRAQRRATLSLDDQVRAWVSTVARFAEQAGPVDAVVRSGNIPRFEDWGAEGALELLFHHPVTIYDVGTPRARALMEAGAPVLVWDSGYRKLHIERRAPDAPDLSYIQMNGFEPLWQLGEGWRDLEGNFRWTDPVATARLARPDGARKFALRTIVVHPVTVTVSLNGAALPPRRFEGEGWQTAEWDLPPAPAGAVTVEFQCDSRPLGIAVGGFGFIAPR